MTAFRITGMGRSALATPALFTTRTSSRRRGSCKASPGGAASTRGPVSRSRSCRWPSSSRIRRACCAPPTRTVPGRTALSTRRAASRAETAGGYSTSDYASGSSATRCRRRQTVTQFRSPRCSTSRTTTTSASCATSALTTSMKQETRCFRRVIAAAGSCCSPTLSPSHEQGRSYALAGRGIRRELFPPGRR